MSLVNLVGILAAAMGGGGGPPPPSGDPDFANVAALVEFITPTDLSSFARTANIGIHTQDVNTTGNVITSSDVTSKFGTRSLLLPNGGDCALTYGDANADSTIRFGSSDFCIEFWWKHNAEFSVTSFWYGSWLTNGNFRSVRCGYNPTTNQVTLETSTNGTSTAPAYQLAAFDCDTDGVSVATLFDNNWHHLAFRRSGSELAVYVDGIKGSVTGSIGTSSIYIRPLSGQFYYIGASSATLTALEPAASARGHMSEFRLTIGNARYTGTSFTPPTAIFGRNSTDDPNFSQVVLLMSFDEEFGLGYYGNQTPTVNLRSENTNGPDLVNSRLNVQANDTVLRVLASGAWDLGSADFTIEIFGFNPASFVVDRTILANWNAVDGERGWRVSATGVFGEDIKFIYTTDGTTATVVSLGVVDLTTNTEYNLCIERQGSNLYFYVDGTLVDTRTITATIFAASTANTALCIGAAGDEATRSNAYTSAYVKGVRLTKNVARYGGANYTVPTLPLPKSV